MMQPSNKSLVSLLVTLTTVLAVVLISTVASTIAASHGAKRDSLLRDYWRNATKRTPGSLVPQPKVVVYQNEQDYLEIEPTNFKLNDCLPKRCLIVGLAKARYLNEFLFNDVGPERKDDSISGKRRPVGQLLQVDLAASADFKCEMLPHPDMNEAYNLTVSADYSSTNDAGGGPKYRASIVAPTSWGFLRGLETLSQLIFNIRTENGRGKFGIRPVEIKDEPRFKHRGFMLDTARHYISLNKIVEIIDAMAIDKLNVFHWHMVDDQSWPYQSAAYPQLSAENSFRPDLVYTPKDVKFIILYAATRGIRVMPELDTPGHTYALRHIPNLLSECFDAATGKPNGDYGPVDPTKPSAYRAVDKLLDEFKSVFPDAYFHAGGDEVEFDCWKSNKKINIWMAERNISGKYEELNNYYMRELYKMVTKHHKTMIVWEEVFDLGANLPKDAIVHVWKYINQKPAYMMELANVVKAGYNALLSSCWYLNYIDYGQDWIKFYQCDPRGEPVPKENQHQVLGGEICMWSEFVDDTNVVSRTWPRASAAAERLWSPMSANNIEEFLPRLEQHRCHLIRRGVQAEPVNGPGYC